MLRREALVRASASGIQKTISDYLRIIRKPVLFKSKLKIEVIIVN